jgi:hypothetical protein
MVGTLFGSSLGFWQRLRARGEGLPQHPDRRRRLRAAFSLSSAIGLGLLSSQGLQLRAIEQYEDLNAPTPELIGRVAALRGYAPTDEALASHLPPLDRAHHVWWELPARRLWWVGRNGTVSVFTKSGAGTAPRGTPEFQLLGAGWKALGPALDALAPKPVIASDPAGVSIRRPTGQAPRHPREWLF